MKCHGSGRVGSGQEVFKSRGSGRVVVTQPDPRKALVVSDRVMVGVTGSSVCLVRRARSVHFMVE